VTRTSRVAVGLLCHERPAELETAIASAQGFDEVVVVDMASEPPLARPSGARLVREDTNIGVAAGRNRLAALAESEILVFLDDDAVLHGAGTAALVRDAFDTDPNLAVLAFRVVRAGGTSVSAEHPFRGAPRSVDRRRSCAYFLGGACAVRREVFLDVGGFDERFRYSTEEIDLAMTLLRRGYDLLYEPAIIVEHRPSPRGRAPDASIPALRLRNRLLFVRRHLPVLVAVVHAAAWGTRTLMEAVRAHGVAQWAAAWRTGLRQPVPREPLTYAQLWRVHGDGGRVLW
jgi:GT2 family glycosyltransferase